MGNYVGILDQYVIQKPINYLVDIASEKIRKVVPQGKPLSETRTDWVLAMAKTVGRPAVEDLKTLETSLYLRPVEYVQLSLMTLARKVYFFANSKADAEVVKQSIVEKVKSQVLSSFKKADDLATSADALKTDTEDLLTTELLPYSANPTGVQLAGFITNLTTKSTLHWAARSLVTYIVVNQVVPNIGNIPTIVTLVGLYGLTLAITPSTRKNLADLKPSKIDPNKILSNDVRKAINNKAATLFEGHTNLSSFKSTITKMELTSTEAAKNPFSPMKAAIKAPTVPSEPEQSKPEEKKKAPEKKKVDTRFVIKEAVTTEWLEEQIGILEQDSESENCLLACDLYGKLKKAMESGKNPHLELRGYHQNFLSQAKKSDPAAIEFATRLTRDLYFNLPPPKAAAPVEKKEKPKGSSSAALIVSASSTPARPSRPSLVTSPSPTKETTSPVKEKKGSKEEEKKLAPKKLFETSPPASDSEGSGEEKKED